MSLDKSLDWETRRHFRLYLAAADTDLMTSLPGDSAVMTSLPGHRCVTWVEVVVENVDDQCPQFVHTIIESRLSEVGH